MAIFFTGEFFNRTALTQSILAFIAFCAASSSLYVFNDLQDLEKDRLHPFKRNRPLASGKLPTSWALVTSVVLTVVALAIGVKISIAFTGLLAFFYLLQISYSLVLKNIILLDILTIAAGFILRVFAGETASGFHIDIWLFLTVVSVALFIAIGKRRSELTLLSGWNGSFPTKTRATLLHYSEKMLDVYISMFANSAWITYAFYTFLQRPPVFRRSILTLLEGNDFLQQERKWMMVTIPIIIYGIMRYLQLIYERNQGESPEKVILTDRPLIITAVILGTSLFMIIYIIGR